MTVPTTDFTRPEPAELPVFAFTLITPPPEAAGDVAEGVPLASALTVISGVVVVGTTLTPLLAFPPVPEVPLVVLTVVEP